jgi:hypothetical protein
MVTTSRFCSKARREMVMPSWPNVSLAQARPRSSTPGISRAQKPSPRRRWVTVWSPLGHGLRGRALGRLSDVDPVYLFHRGGEEAVDLGCALGIRAEDLRNASLRLHVADDEVTHRGVLPVDPLKGAVPRPVSWPRGRTLLDREVVGRG